MALTDTLDQLITRLLWVTPQPPADDAPESPPQERNLGLALLISALRCTLQYVILPVVLPLVGLVGSFSLAIVLLLDRWLSGCSSPASATSGAPATRAASTSFPSPARSCWSSSAPWATISGSRCAD
jgi:hypothetical protein